jgi:hypothetical protein
MRHHYSDSHSKAEIKLTTWIRNSKNLFIYMDWPIRVQFPTTAVVLARAQRLDRIWGTHNSCTVGPGIFIRRVMWHENEVVHSLELQTRRKQNTRVSDLFICLGNVMVSVLAIGPKVSGFKPGRGDGFSRAIKSIAHLSSEGSKAASPMSLDFTACKSHF